MALELIPYKVDQMLGAKLREHSVAGNRSQPKSTGQLAQLAQLAQGLFGDGSESWSALQHESY